MKTDSLGQFRKNIENYSIRLIIAADDAEREEGIQAALTGPPVVLTAMNFNEFSQEVETLPFLSKKRHVLLKYLEDLKKDEIEKVLTYVKNPNPHVILTLSARALTGKLLKVVDECGTIYHLPTEKPWERERRLADTLSHEAAAQGVVLPLPIATEFVKAFGTDKSLLKQELSKLICYVGERKAVTAEDIRAISVPMPQETLWQLGEALFSSNFPLAHSTLLGLLQEGIVIFPILSSLRSQSETALRTLQAHQRGGNGAVQKEFPYLKGRLLDKKMNLYNRFGQAKLQKTLHQIFLAELEARNSALPPEWILEKLLVKLT